MSKHTPSLEWQLAPDNAEWPILPLLPSSSATTAEAADVAARWHINRWLWGATTVFIVLTVVGYWVWHTAQVGLAQIDTELSNAVQLELAPVKPVLAPRRITWATDPMGMAWEGQLQRERDILHAASPPDLLESLVSTDMHMLYQHGDVAVTDFVMIAEDGTEAYRQTRFYRQSAEGWERIRTYPKIAMLKRM